MLTSAVQLAIRRPWRVVLATLAIVLFIAGHVRSLTFSNDYRDYFSEANPQLQAWEALQQVYTKNDNVLITLTPRSGDVFDRATLRAVSELTDAGWRVPYANRVDSISNFQYARAEGDDLVVGDLVPDADRPDADLRTIALAQPELVGRLLAADGATTAVNINTILPDNPRAAITETATYVYALVDRFRAEHPDIEFHLTGALLYNHALAQASEHDMKTLVPLMYLAILTALGVLLHSVSSVLIGALVITFGALVAMGFAGMWGMVLSAASIGAPTIIMTLAVANTVHLLDIVILRMRAGERKEAAVAESIRLNLQPIFITNLTTAIGFLSMNFSDVPPYRDLGNLVAVGILAVFLLSVLLVPALAMLLPLRPGPARPGTRNAMTSLGTLVARHATSIVVIALVAGAVLAASIPKIELDDMFVEWMDHRYTFRVDTDYVADHLAGIYRLEYSVDAGGEGEVADPGYLGHLERLAQWLRRQPGVTHVDSFTDVMKRLNRNMHGDDPTYDRVPGDRREAAQYLLLYEMSLPFGLDMNNQVNVRKSSTRLSVTTDNLSTSRLLALEDRIEAWMRTNLPAHMRGHAASTTILFANISKRNIRSLLGGTSLALVAISLILVVPLRSLKLGAVCLITNVLPIVMGFGIWALMYGEVGLAISIVVGMTFGIVVDDTVHFVSKYVRYRREHGADAPTAVRYSLETAGQAMWKTSVILVLGFGLLASSGFALNAQMGLLTSIIIALALACDMLLLPALLMKLDRPARAAVDAVAGETGAP